MPLLVSPPVGREEWIEYPLQQSRHVARVPPRGVRSDGVGRVPPRGAHGGAGSPPGDLRKMQNELNEVLV